MTEKIQKKVALKTYGCQMNVYDSNRMVELLAPSGYTLTEELSAADLVILNTCYIREKAAEKVYSELGRLNGLKRANAALGKKMLVAVAGCVAQAEGEEVVNRSQAVDIVIGPQAYHRLPDLVAKATSTGRSIVETDLSVDQKFAALNRHERRIGCGVTAFVTVQEGCDKFCTFCVVPYTRGAEYSRPVQEIEREVRSLAQSGVREITLLGQNVSSYHGASSAGKDCSLGRLIEHLSAIEGIERIRYMTSHPCDMDEDLLAAHQDNRKLMPYLHLPVQSGSDRILKKMNRPYTAQDYLDTVSKLRKARPDLALSSDFIVGFPGETESDFADTVDLVKTVGYAQAYSFKYSPRPGTPSSIWSNQIESEVKSERLQRLQSLLGAQQTEFNRSCVGRRLNILLERPGRHSGQLIGRSPYLQAVHVDAGSAKIGEFVVVEIAGVGRNSLSAHIVGSC